MKSSKRYGGARWHDKVTMQPYDYFVVEDESGPSHLLVDTMGRIEGASQTLVALADEDTEVGEALALLAEELFEVKMDVCKVVGWFNDRVLDNLKAKSDGADERVAVDVSFYVRPGDKSDFVEELRSWVFERENCQCIRKLSTRKEKDGRD